MRRAAVVSIKRRWHRRCALNSDERLPLEVLDLGCLKERTRGSTMSTTRRKSEWYGIAAAREQFICCFQVISDAMRR
jgi:hypothetical protein